VTSGPPAARATLAVARPVPPVARRRAELAGRAGLAASLASVVLTFGVAVAGPSVMEPALPGAAGQPPWSAALHLPAGLAMGLAAAALALAATGVGLCLHAARHGWAVSPRLLLGAGLIAAAALTLVPPFGSADHLSYAAYGRMAVTGHDPYTTTPAMLASLGDPVARAVQDWRHSPSVYGSAATGVQAVAAAIGGRSARGIVFVLSLLNLAAFAGTGLLAHRLARGRRDRQLRAALLWTANPLLLQVLVAGAHVDALAVCCAVSALGLFSLSLRYAGRATLTPAEILAPVTPEPVPPSAPTSGRLPRWHIRGRWRQRPPKNVVDGVIAHKPARAAAAPPGSLLRCFLIAIGAGAATGLAFGVKISLALVFAGLILAAVLAAFPQDGIGRQSFAVVTTGLACGFAVIATAAFIPWGTQALGPALRAGSYVSIGSPWRPVRSALHLAMAEATANDLVRAGAVILAAAVLALFARPLTALARRHQDRTEALTLVAASVFAVVFAWLVAWTYVLPWYDGLAWALLALLPWLPAPWAALDWLVLARTTVLALGYLPAQGIALPPGLDWTRTVVRSGATPLLLLGTAVLLVVVLRSGRQERIAR
jgi:hypothetical protein